MWQRKEIERKLKEFQDKLKLDVVKTDKEILAFIMEQYLV